ncbi:unnamed protein product, partial [Arabidopsis halleri]
MSTKIVAAKSGDSTNPAYKLSSADNPGSMITSVSLTGDNYNEWASEMLNALRAKKKMGFVDGTLPKPAADSVRVHHLRTQLASCRQDGQPVIDYYGKLAAMWDELYTYKPLPKSAEEFAKEREEEKIHQFVMGLDESKFGNIVNSIIDADPSPDIAQAYAKVIREEQRLHSVKSREQHEAVGFVTRRDDSSPSHQTTARRDGGDSTGLVSRPDASFLTGANRNRDRNSLCAHCGKLGHEKNFCWQIHGYPEWWTERSLRNGGRGSNRGRGSQSAGRGRGPVTAAHATSSNGSVFPDF